MKDLTRDQIEELEDAARQIRCLATKIIAQGRWGHIGGSYSVADILAVLYWRAAETRPQDPAWPLRDTIILSKAHCSPALYAALALRGFFPMERTASYASFDGLDGHLSALDTPGVECSGGSLGLGLSFAAGVAGALKLQERYSQRVYCILGDGELSEGQVWEAAMACSQHRLDNLIAVVDYNKVMAKGFLYEEMGQGPLRERFESFGFRVIETDGHDAQELVRAFYDAKYLGMDGRPACILAHTVKGRGVRECEFNYRWHTSAPAREVADRFLEELSGSGAAPCPEGSKPPDGGMRDILGGDDA